MYGTQVNSFLCIVDGQNFDSPVRGCGAFGTQQSAGSFDGNKSMANSSASMHLALEDSADCDVSCKESDVRKLSGSSGSNTSTALILSGMCEVGLEKEDSGTTVDCNVVDRHLEGKPLCSNNNNVFVSNLSELDSSTPVKPLGLGRKRSLLSDASCDNTHESRHSSFPSLDLGLDLSAVNMSVNENNNSARHSVAENNNVSSCIEGVSSAKRRKKYDVAEAPLLGMMV